MYHIYSLLLVYFCWKYQIEECRFLILVSGGTTSMLVNRPALNLWMHERYSRPEELTDSPALPHVAFISFGHSGNCVLGKLTNRFIVTGAQYWTAHFRLNLRSYRDSWGRTARKESSSVGNWLFRFIQCYKVAVSYRCAVLKRTAISLLMPLVVWAAITRRSRHDFFSQKPVLF